MKQNKNNVAEHINLLRNNIIDIWGETRNMFVLLENFLAASDKIDIEALKKINKKIKRQLFLFDEENAEIITDTKLEDNDIRFILGGMRLVSDFERISLKIIKFSCLYNSITYSGELSPLVEIINFLTTMFDKLFIGFTYSEIDKCYEVIDDDKTIDDLRTKNKNVILDKMMKNEDFISKGINLITQTESLERIGDYIVSISQDIAYILSGKDTRYSG